MPCTPSYHNTIIGQGRERGQDRGHDSNRTGDGTGQDRTGQNRTGERQNRETGQRAGQEQNKSLKSLTTITNTPTLTEIIQIF